jgi:RecA/RadA recombinase
MRDVILLTGPPGSGKTTLAYQLAADRHLLHLEREDYPDDDAYLTAATNACTPPDAKAIVVRCCATLNEQDHWQHAIQPTETRTLDTPLRICLRRIADRRRPRWRAEIMAAKRWHAERGTT